MSVLSFTMLLEYLYKKFLVSFILALLGSFMKETLKTTKLQKIESRKIIIPAIFTSVLMCALVDYINIPFGIYVAVNIVAGMWGYQLISLALNANFMKKFVFNLFKNAKASTAKSLVDTLEQTEKIEKKKENPDSETEKSESSDPDDKK